MKWLHENWFKLGIVVGIFFIGAILYQALVTVPLKEETMRIETQKEKTANDEAVAISKQEEDKKNNDLKQQKIDQCLASAQINYSNQWASTCKINADAVTRGYNNCTDTVSASYCRNLWGAADDSANCSLPGKTADALNLQLKSDKDDCYKYN